MIGLLVSLAFLSWEPAGLPEPQPGDSEVVEITVGEMRRAVWYYEQYNLLEEYVMEDLTPAYKKLFLDYELLSDHYKDLTVENRQLRESLEREIESSNFWLTIASVSGGVVLALTVALIVTVVL